MHRHPKPMQEQERIAETHTSGREKRLKCSCRAGTTPTFPIHILDADDGHTGAATNNYTILKPVPSASARCQRLPNTDTGLVWRGHGTGVEEIHVSHLSYLHLKSVSASDAVRLLLVDTVNLPTVSFYQYEREPVEQSVGAAEEYPVPTIVFYQ
ncbi:hypothetical protein C8F01DRAFT_1244259 [Mycena amicta]|nr:hypothetical protein C8F01DRAFT_1244259 [Mycena amicta]